MVAFQIHAHFWLSAHSAEVSTLHSHKPSEGPVAARLLEGYKEQEYVSAGWSEGFESRFQGKRCPLLFNNSLTVNRKLSVTLEKVSSEVALGRTADHYEPPSLCKHEYSSKQLREKPTPGKYIRKYSISFCHDDEFINANKSEELLLNLGRARDYKKLWSLFLGKTRDRRSSKVDHGAPILLQITEFQVKQSIFFNCCYPW